MQTKSQVTKATNNLVSAISNLKNNKPTKPVALPTDDSKITHIKTLKDLKCDYSFKWKILCFRQ